MINVLLVDDDDQKSAKVQAVIHQLVEQHGVIVERARTAHDAVTALRRKRHLDLMIVDLNIPLREGADPTPVGGVRLIESLSEKVNSDLGTPVHIVGLTAFDPLIQQYEKFFDDRLWHLVRFSAESNDWVSQIGKKLVHIAETKLPARRDNYEVDLAIVTALHHVELESVLALDAGWQQQQFAEDETLYHMGEFRRDSKSLRVVAAAAVEMGMPAATALSMNVITRFRPRYLAMAGIAAGIKGNFGDILIATHSWDYGCGKSRFQLGRSEFLPAPSQVQLNPLLKSKLSLFCMDESALRRIQAEWRGKPMPTTTLAWRMGPIASGSAVLENAPLIDEIRSHNAKVIGVEMETYGVFMAARLCSEPRPMVMSVKSICDFGDLSKNDEYQRYAGYTSARFIHDFALAQL